MPVVSRNQLRSLCCALGVLLTVACASTTTKRAEILSDQAVVLDMPLVEQDEMYECGLVSVSALCDYWHLPLEVDERARLAKLARTQEGLSGGELCDALQRAGCETYLFQGTLDRTPTGLLHHVDAGRPLLVMISPETDKHHYVLFLGYDELQRNVIVLDPVRGRVIQPYESFQRSWSECERFTLLAMPESPDAVAQGVDS